MDDKKKYNCYVYIRNHFLSECKCIYYTLSGNFLLIIILNLYCMLYPKYYKYADV